MDGSRFRRIQIDAARQRVGERAAKPGGESPMPRGACLVIRGIREGRTDADSLAPFCSWTRFTSRRGVREPFAPALTSARCLRSSSPSFVCMHAESVRGCRLPSSVSCSISIPSAPRLSRKPTGSSAGAAKMVGRELHPDPAHACVEGLSRSAQRRSLHCPGRRFSGHRSPQAGFAQHVVQRAHLELRMLRHSAPCVTG